MKKFILFTSVIGLVLFTVSCNFSKSNKLESEIKTKMKKEAKLNGVKLSFNEIECIELDTIPDEFNTPYMSYMFDAEYYLNEAENTIDEVDFALRWGYYHGKSANELKREADSIISLSEAKHNMAIGQRKLNKKKSYLVYIDYITKVGGTPFRTQQLALYVYDKSNNCFDMLYHSDYNCQERFNNYR